MDSHRKGFRSYGGLGVFRVKWGIIPRLFGDSGCLSRARATSPIGRRIRAHRVDVPPPQGRGSSRRRGEAPAAGAGANLRRDGEVGGVRGTTGAVCIRHPVDVLGFTWGVGGSWFCRPAEPDACRSARSCCRGRHYVSWFSWPGFCGPERRTRAEGHAGGHSGRGRCCRN
jgi:hypothetical protein